MNPTVSTELDQVFAASTDMSIPLPCLCPWEIGVASVPIDYPEPRRVKHELTAKIKVSAQENWLAALLSRSIRDRADTPFLLDLKEIRYRCLVYKLQSQQEYRRAFHIAKLTLLPVRVVEPGEAILAADWANTMKWEEFVSLASKTYALTAATSAVSPSGTTTETMGQ
jgi:hypothetical protein